MKRTGVILGVLFATGLCVFGCILSPLGRGSVILPHIQMPAERLPLGPIALPNSVVATLLTDLILIIGAAVGTRHIRAGRTEALVPTGLQNLVEWIVEFLSDLLKNVLGEEREAKMFPLLATFFLFILFANWMELLPGFDSVGLIERVHEGMEGHAIRRIGPLVMLIAEKGEHTLIPFLRAAATDLNTPLALALVSVVMTHVYSVQEMGFVKYYSRFFNVKALIDGGPMGIMDFVVGLLESVSEFTKIISFTFRLFGNLFAGMVLLLVISSLAPFLAPVVFYFLELFVGAVQALVFMMLTAGFIAVAMADHGDEH